MASPTLKDLGVALGGLLGPKADAYAAGAGGAVTGGILKARAGLLSELQKLGNRWGRSLGEGAVTIPGAIAAGAAKTGAEASAEFERKYLGLSVTQMLVVGFLVLGGVILWFLRSKR